MRVRVRVRVRAMLLVEVCRKLRYSIKEHMPSQHSNRASPLSSEAIKATGPWEENHMSGHYLLCEPCVGSSVQGHRDTS